MPETISEKTTSWYSRLLAYGWLMDLGFASVSLALLWLVYAPSLKHMPRADQWCFLVDTIDQHTFWDIFTHSYSYNRTRRIMPGDTDLYRPLLFAVLSAEKALFAADFAAYQGVGILLHWGVVCLLLILLRNILAFTAETGGPNSLSSPLSSWASRLLSYGVCLFFALNKSVQELVIWSHLHGYLVFLIFLLTSLILLLRYIRQPTSWWNLSLWGSWLFALLSAFTYEMGQLYAVLAGVFLVLALPRGTETVRRWVFGGLFIAILALYQGADRLDRWIHREQFSPEGVRAQIRERALSRETVTHSKRFLAYTVAQPFFPSLWRGALAGGRVVMGEAEWNRGHFNHFPPVLLISILTVSLATGLGVFGLIRLLMQRHKLSLLFFLLTLGLYTVYLAMIVLGRMNIRPGPHCLSTNSYYGHMGLLLALVPICILWQSASYSRIAAVGQLALLFGLTLLTCYSAPAVWHLNKSVAQDMKGCREVIAALNRFVREHKDEHDFSMAIDFEASDPVGSEYHFPIPMIVFKRWLHPEPKYIVTLQGGKVYAHLRY